MPASEADGGPGGRGRGVPIERVRDEHPAGDSWRADALAASRHSRLLDELRRPLDDHRPARAAEVCGDVARAVLRDFSPALILLPGAERRRAQALAAYALTLFDFAGQTGLEGERLSQINRWEFELEAALSGRPSGQPVWVLLAAEERRRPWPREALDALGDAARGVVARGRSPRPDAAARTAGAIGAALASALLGEGAPAAAGRLAAALLRLRKLQDLGEGLRRRRPGLPAEELPGADRGEEIPAETISEAVRAECARLAPELAAAKDAREALPAAYRRAARYLDRAAKLLLEKIENLRAEVVDSPPSLGALTRIALLLRAGLLG